MKDKADRHALIDLDHIDPKEIIRGIALILLACPLAPPVIMIGSKIVEQIDKIRVMITK